MPHYHVILLIIETIFGLPRTTLKFTSASPSQPCFNLHLEPPISMAPRLAPRIGTILSAAMRHAETLQIPVTGQLLRNGPRTPSAVSSDLHLSSVFHASLTAQCLDPGSDSQPLGGGSKIPVPECSERSQIEHFRAQVIKPLLDDIPCRGREMMKLAENKSE